MLEQINWEFGDILAGGTFEQSDALPEEANEPELADLPRLRFRFDRHAIGRLRQLIDVINAEANETLPLGSAQKITRGGLLPRPVYQAYLRVPSIPSVAWQP